MAFQLSEKLQWRVIDTDFVLDGFKQASQHGPDHNLAQGVDRLFERLSQRLGNKKGGSFNKDHMLRINVVFFLKFAFNEDILQLLWDSPLPMIEQLGKTRCFQPGLQKKSDETFFQELRTEASKGWERVLQFVSAKLKSNDGSRGFHMQVAYNFWRNSPSGFSVKLLSKLALVDKEDVVTVVDADDYLDKRKRRFGAPCANKRPRISLTTCSTASMDDAPPSEIFPETCPMTDPRFNHVPTTARFQALVAKAPVIGCEPCISLDTFKLDPEVQALMSEVPDHMCDCPFANFLEELFEQVCDNDKHMNVELFEDMLLSLYENLRAYYAAEAR